MGLIFVEDPGLTTGIAILNRIGKSKQFSVYRSGVLLWHNRFKIQNILQGLKPQLEAVVIEEFKLFGNPATLHAQIGSDMPSSQMIGITTLACYNLGLSHLVTFQTPRDIHDKDFNTKKKVYRLDFNPGDKAKLHKSQHGIDSYLHGKFYIFTHWEK